MNLFLSCTVKDQQIAEQLKLRISNISGVQEVKSEKDLLGGDEIMSKLQEWINGSDVYVVLLSSDYLNSKERSRNENLFNIDRPVVCISIGNCNYTDFYQDEEKYHHLPIDKSNEHPKLLPINAWEKLDWALDSTASQLKKIIDTIRPSLFWPSYDEILQDNFNKTLELYLASFGYELSILHQEKTSTQRVLLDHNIVFVPLDLGKAAKNKDEFLLYVKDKKHKLFFIPIDFMLNKNLLDEKEKQTCNQYASSILNGLNQWICEQEMDHLMHICDVKILFD